MRATCILGDIAGAMTSVAFVTPCVGFRTKQHLLRLVSQRRPRSATARFASRPIRAESDDFITPETTTIPEAGAVDLDSGAVVISPSYTLAGVFTFLGGLCFYVGGAWLVPGFPILSLGCLLSIQTTRIRFVFGPTKLNVATRKSDGLEFIRGWAYEDISNWEFWWPKLPTLAYFKESESYNGRGSIHFFPILCDGAQLLDELKKHTPHLDKSKYP